MIVITGASDGLGKELAVVLKSKGHTILNVSRNTSDVAQANVAADLSTDEGVEEAVKTVTALNEKIEAIIHNAGLLSLDSLDSVTPAEYDRLMAVNVRAPLLMTAQLIERIKRDGTDLVFIGSVASLEPFADQAIYDISKHALKGLTDDLRLELKDYESRVIGIYPGMLETEMSQKIPGKDLPKSRHAAINPSSVAELIAATLAMPKNAEVSDIVIRRKVTRK